MIRDKRFLKLIIFLSITIFLLSSIMLSIFHIELLAQLIVLSIINALAVGILVYLKFHKSCKKLNSELFRNKKINEMMLQLAHATATINEQEDFFQQLLEKAVEVVEDSTKGSLLVIDNDNKFVYKAAIGFDMNILKTIKLEPDQISLWHQSDNPEKETLIVRSIDSSDVEHFSQEVVNALRQIGTNKIKSTICSPIQVNGEVYGVINIDSEKENAFNNTDVELIKYFSLMASKVITMYHNMEKTIHLARYDCLTDVLNRQYFEEMFNTLLGTTQIKFCLVSIDLNNLKRVNDVFGHAMGDKIIIEFAKVIKQHLAPKDLFARIGGDEFVVIIVNQSPKQVEAKFDEILNIFSQNPLNANDVKLPISFSYGISEYPNNGTNFEALYQLADKKMYAHKKKLKSKIRQSCENR